MKDFLEAVYSLVDEIIKKLNIKDRKRKKWAMTIIFTVVFAVLIAAVALAVYFLYGTEPNGTLIVWGLTAVMTIAAIVFVIRGHLKEWEPY